MYVLCTQMLIKLRKGKFWTSRLRQKFLRHSGSHVSCLMKQAVNAPIWGRFVNAVGSVASCYALSGIRTSSLVENALPPLAKPCRDMANDGIFSAALQVSLYKFFIVNQFVPPPTA